MVVHEAIEARAQPRADHTRVLLEPILLDDVEHSESGRRRYGVSAERIEVNPLRERLRDLHPRRDRTDRSAVAEALGHGDDVRDDVEVLEAPVVVPGSTEAGLDLVGDAHAARLAG